MDDSPPGDLAHVRSSTEALVHTLGHLTDESVRAPSLLPGWTRGHVVTHVCRNADALRNLVEGVAAGEDRSMYASAEQRNADIEAGAYRPVEALHADVVESAQRLDAALSALTPDQWAAPVVWGHGRSPAPASLLPVLRRAEVEIHHVDLYLDYTIAHWPEDFVELQLARVVPDFTEAGRPGITLVGNDGEGTWVVGDGAQPIEGPPPALLGWLIGRTDGQGLHSDHPLPEMGVWR